MLWLWEQSPGYLTTPQGLQALLTCDLKQAGSGRAPGSHLPLGSSLSGLFWAHHFQTAAELVTGVTWVTPHTLRKSLLPF
jgi:hypothetical protein